MRDINETLKVFANESNMDYCRHFDRIKATLEYCNGQIKSFEKIHFRGGNEGIINDIVAKLEEHIRHLNDIEHEHDLRKITFFLILNTDVSYSYDLKSDEKIVHVIDIIPQLPKCLLLSIVWELKLDKYFYECLTYTPCWFSMQFIEATVASLKYLEPYDVLDKVENLVIAIFATICRSDYRQIDIISKKRILSKLYDHAMELLRQFYTPDIEKFSDWSKREFFKYSGFAIRHICKMVLSCFDSLEYPLRRKVEEKFGIYEICKELCLKNEAPDDGGYTDVARDILNKILVALFNTLQYNVMLVTLDVFMHWAEVDINDEMTLQADIGDYAYRVLERMNKNKDFGHDVGNHLKFIAIRPKTLKEMLKEANIGDVLRKLESDSIHKPEKQLWLNELLSRPVIYGNDECLETLLSNASLINYENCIQILDSVKKIQDDISDDSSLNIDDMIPEIVIKALENLKTDQLLEIVLYEIKCFGKDATIFQSETIELKCTVFLNKSTENIDTKLFLQLCFENPTMLWKKVFEYALTSSQQGKNFCTLAKSVMKLSKLYIQELVELSFPAKCEEKFYPHLLFEIHECGVIDKDIFFKHFIYKNVNTTLETQNIAPLLPLIQALNMIVHKTKTVPTFGSITAPVLVMIAQILDHCRWDLVTYSDLNDEIVRLSIDCIQMTNKTFLPIVTEKVRDWIKTRVNEFKPLTRYYFQKYSLAVSDQLKTFDEFLRVEPLDDDKSIEKFLIMNYVRCTMKETEWLAKCELLRPHISNVLILLESLVSEIGETAMPNIRQSIGNYANLVKKILLPNIDDHDHEKFIELSMIILRIIQNSPAIFYDETFMNFHEILLCIFDKLKPLNDEVVASVKDYLATMKNCKGKEIFEQKFEQKFCM